MSKGIWFAYGKTESREDFQVGYWTSEPTDENIAEVILDKYEWVLDPEIDLEDTPMSPKEACEESLVYWSKVHLEEITFE